jgi:hypothetical protein
VNVGRDPNRKFFAAALSAWLCLGAVLAVTTSGTRTGIGIGWALAGMLSALSFGALVWVRRRSLQDLLIVVVGGFLVRMVVVGVTLVLMLHANADPLRFALGFFSAYLLLQILEVAWLNGQARQARQPHRELPT